MRSAPRYRRTARWPAARCSSGAPGPARSRADRGRMAMNCVACDGQLPPQARFCPGCGSPATAATPVEERKLVTVLFCDLVGSTPLSEVLDPETLRSVTLRYFAAMGREIEERGGTVEKFIGDAVMAVFGVPTMHEDDARRAAEAALSMLRALAELNAELEPAVGVRLRVRIG